MMLSEFASKYVGIKEGTNEHKKIIDTYNTIKPLPHGYKVTYKDSWCACFVSFCLYSLGINKELYDCRANSMYDKSRINGEFTKTPKKNDIIFYRWKETGNINHVGIVEKLDNKYVYTIEGNYSNSVKRRKINRKSKYIVGYSETASTKTVTKIDENLIKDIINGEYGNGETRKKNIENMGLKYREVQDKVNEYLKKVLD